MKCIFKLMLYSTVLENIVYISNQLVILQTLRAGYKTELDCDTKQEIKNFRSNALISASQDILNYLEPYMHFLAECEEGTIEIPPNQLHNITFLIKDLTEFYDWTIKEVKLRNKRLALMKLEEEWNKENI